jgi:hypothetical protein
MPGDEISYLRRVESIKDRYGEFLTLEEVAEVLRYKTVEAARKAHDRGTLAVELRRFPNRRGYFATAEAVAQCIEDLDNK